MTSNRAEDTATPDQPGFQVRPRLTRDRLLFSIFALALAADQITKGAIASLMTRGESFPAEGFFRLTYTTNTGSAFGLFQGQTIALTVASFVGIGVLLYLYHTHPAHGRLLRLSLGLQLAGAVGNLADRLRLGYVVDFLDAGPWPIFNLADSSIVVGITILVALFLLDERTAKERRSVEKADSFPEPAPPIDDR